MRQLFFENNIDDEKYMGILYGLGRKGQRYTEPVNGLTLQNML